MPLLFRKKYRFGKLIFRGSPADVAASPIVRAAYLGSDEVMEAVER